MQKQIAIIWNRETVTSFITAVLGAAAFLFTLVLLCVYYFSTTDKTERDNGTTIFLFVVYLCCFFGYLMVKAALFHLRKFSLDEKGIIIYTPFKGNTFLPWECICKVDKSKMSVNKCDEVIIRCFCREPSERCEKGRHMIEYYCWCKEAPFIITYTDERADEFRKYGQALQ